MKRILYFVSVVVLLLTVIAGSFVITSSAESGRRLKEGDVILETPIKTTDKRAEITESSKIAEGTFTLGWDAYESAASYTVKIFFNIANEDAKEGVDFRYIGDVASETTSITIGGLAPNWRYTVVIYALDADGNEIATYDRIPVATIPPLEEVEEQPEKEGLSLIIVVIIAAAAVLVVAAVVIVIVLVATKPKKR